MPHSEFASEDSSSRFKFEERNSRREAQDKKMMRSVLILLMVCGAFPAPIPQHVEDPDFDGDHPLIVFPAKKNATEVVIVPASPEANVGSETSSLIATQKVTAVVEIIAACFSLFIFIAGAVVAFLKFRARAQGDADDVNRLRLYAAVLARLLVRMRRRQQ